MATMVIARAADTFTLARFPLSVLLLMAIATAQLFQAAALLICCWITDCLDGFLARRAAGETRLAWWDPVFDGMMGVGLMGGMVLGGYVPVLWLIPVLILGGLLFIVHSLASGMLLQGMAYGWFLWTLGTEDRDALNLTLAAVGVAAIIYGHRIPRVLLPRFFADLARLKRGYRIGAGVGEGGQRETGTF